MTTSATGSAAVSQQATPPPLTLPPGTSPIAEGTVSRETAADGISPKVSWAAAAAALATIVWTIVGELAPNVFSAATIATLTGATGTLLGFAGGYLVRDKLRHQP